MNTVKSFWVGMATLSAAGGGAYYFAKKSINADRLERFEKDRARREMQLALESSSTGHGGPARSDITGSPSQEASTDPAPTRHAPESEAQRLFEKSKYEASEPFRARKGDRFS